MASLQSTNANCEINQTHANNLAEDLTQKLPVEVFSIVFMMLHDGLTSTTTLASVSQRTLILHVPLVCRRWRDICQTELPPITLDLRWGIQRYSNPLTDAGLAALTTRFRISGVILEYCRCVSDKGLATIATHCPQLEVINLAHCYVTERGLAELGGVCDSLKVINLLGCSNISADGLEKFLSKCTSVTTLCLTSLSVTKNTLGVVAPTLTSIDLENCLIIVGGGGGGWVHTLAEGRPKLTHLNLAYCSVTNEEMSHLMATCDQLISLNLRGCRDVTDETLAITARACPLLEAINLGSCRRVSAGGLRTLASACPKLKTIDLAHCSWNVTRAAKQLFAHR